MKQITFFLLLLGIIIIVGSNQSSTAASDPSTFVKYHGTRRYWTSVDSDRKTYVTLNEMKDAVNGSVKVFFPKDKNIAQILQDITLYSAANDECRADTDTLKFKLEFDEQNYIHGDVTAYIRANKIMAYMYDVCNGIGGSRDYASLIIDGQYIIIDGILRTCFRDGDPFQVYDKDNTKNVMNLEVSGNLKCQAFMILPAYMDVEDLPALPADIREPLNATFATQGEDFWWKDSNNESLSDGISFVGRDAVIDITNSTKTIPYFLRIGKNQPYPTLQFQFDANCSNQHYELYVNLRGGGDCRIGLALTETGYTLTTKGVTSEIQDATKSPTLVLARGESKVYAKSGTHLSLVSKEVCQIENSPDVPDDQLVIQIAPSKGSAGCNTAQLLLPAGDIKGKLEILLDRVKAAALIPESGSTESSYSTSAAPIKSTIFPPGATTEAATAGFPWWWVVAGILLFAGLVAGLIGIWLYIRHRRNQSSSSSSKSKKNNGQKAGKKGKSHSKPKAETVVIPVEEPPPPKDKEGKMDNKNNGKNAKQQAAEQEIGGSKKSAKQSRKEPKNHYETLPANPPNQGPPRTPKRQSEAQTTQDDPTLETGSTQPASSIVQTRKSHMSSDYINQK